MQGQQAVGNIVWTPASRQAHLVKKNAKVVALQNRVALAHHQAVSVRVKAIF